MRYEKSLGLLVVAILVGVGIFYFYTPSTEQPASTLFSADFEGLDYNSTLISAGSMSSYSHKNYNNIPQRWEIEFEPSGEFKWDDSVSYSGEKSIRLSNPGGIVAREKIRQIDVNNKFTLTAWVKSNDLKKGFAFAGIEYKDAGDNSVELNRSGKITGSNDWQEIEVHFSAPSDARIRIELKLLDRNEKPDLYEKLRTLMDGTAEINGSLPSEAVWFDDVRITATR